MNILAINPWIVDYAAYDFWLKPYGFLVLLTYLKNKGLNIDYIDCLDKKETQDNFARGKYYSEVIQKPQGLKSIPRYFRRYGISLNEFREAIKDKKPDFILITSSMTYWDPVVLEVKRILKKYFPGIPTVLGGTYATLLHQHARKNIKYDYIFKNDDLEQLFKLLNVSFNYKEFYITLPVYEDFYSRLDYIVLKTAWGMPF